MRAWVTYETPEGDILILKENGSDSVKVIAQVLTEELDDPKATARLIAAAPEMLTALTAVVEALRATAKFFSSNGLDTNELNEIVSAIDDILDSINGAR